SPSGRVRLPMRRNGHIADRLGAWLAGTLPEAEAAEVRRHLDSCAGCAEERDLLREGTSIVPPLPAVEPRVGFATRAAARALELLVLAAAPAASRAQQGPSAEERFRGLPPEKQEELRRRYRELQQLPVEERQRIQENLARLNRMSPDEHARVDENYRRFRAMP